MTTDLQVGDIVCAVAPDGRQFQIRFDGYQDFSVLSEGVQPQFTALGEIPGLTVNLGTTYGHSIARLGFSVTAAAPKPQEVAL